jgi:hypothetical protein
MSAKSNTRKLFCPNCKKRGLPESVYTSHSLHKTDSQNSPLTCPLLLKFVCTNCTIPNHTSDRCKKLVTPVVEQVCPVIKKEIKKVSAFAALDLSDSDSDDDDDIEKLPCEYCANIDCTCLKCDCCKLPYTPIEPGKTTCDDCW